ncbi:MAG: NHL repeat-containing protein [Pirellulales bacterium]
MLLGLISLSGCVEQTRSEIDAKKVQLVYARRGLSEGRFMKPRAITIDAQDQLYMVDMSGRIQVFDADGQFLRYWNTPTIENGRPTGLGVDRDGHILVADTHYFRVLFYTPEGKLLEDRTIGGVNGKGPGEFGFVTDVVQDSQGNFFISEYGEFDRVQKFTPDGKFLCQFGKHGDGPLEFNRPQSMVIDEQDRLWISDACNHRIQVVECKGTEPKLLQMFGQQGKEPGQFQYPYGIAMSKDGTLLITEFGNHRVQRVSREGKSLAIWGSPGKEKGQLNQPWGSIEDSRRRIHVLDSLNHRIQRIQL